MPSYTNHRKAHWYDAARQLRAAARLIQKAAAEYEYDQTTTASDASLRKADTLINAAIARIQDRTK